MQVFEAVSIARDRQSLQFFKALGETPDKAFLGESENRRALEAGAVDILFLSTKLEKPLIKELSKIAERMGTEIKLISVETPEGEQFYNLGGIGSVLRFRV